MLIFQEKKLKEGLHSVCYLHKIWSSYQLMLGCTEKKYELKKSFVETDLLRFYCRTK